MTQMKRKMQMTRTNPRSFVCSTPLSRFFNSDFVHNNINKGRHVSEHCR